MVVSPFTTILDFAVTLTTVGTVPEETCVVISPWLLVKPEGRLKLTPPTDESKVKKTSCWASGLPSELFNKKVTVEISVPPLPLITMELGCTETNSIEPNCSPVISMSIEAILVIPLAVIEAMMTS